MCYLLFCFWIHPFVFILCPIHDARSNDLSRYPAGNTDTCCRSACPRRRRCHRLARHEPFSCGLLLLCRRVYRRVYHGAVKCQKLPAQEIFLRAGGFLYYCNQRAFNPNSLINARCKRLEKLISLSIAILLSHAGIESVFFTALALYFLSYASLSKATIITN